MLIVLNEIHDKASFVTIHVYNLSIVPVAIEAVLGCEFEPLFEQVPEGFVQLGLPLLKQKKIVIFRSVETYSDLR